MKQKLDLLLPKLNLKHMKLMPLPETDPDPDAKAEARPVPEASEKRDSSQLDQSK